MVHPWSGYRTTFAGEILKKETKSRIKLENNLGYREEGDVNTKMHEKCEKTS